MELHPIVDSSDSSTLTSGLWYVASCDVDSATPSARVGVTASFDPVRRVAHIIGGADPDGAHADVFQLHMNGKFRWGGGKQDTLKARYEHAAFRPASKPSSILIFGGADVNGNSNSIQMFDVETHLWSAPSVKGAAPSPRTYRVSESACHGDRFYVFSGGDAGSQPVGDRQLHCFDASLMTWQTLNARGTSPKPRHGHSVVVMGGKVVIFGGMSGHTFYNDLALFDLVTMQWSTQKVPRSGWPSARAGHGAVVIEGDRMAVFGGMSGQGALDDLWILDSNGWKWREVKCDGPPPACRLDFAMTVVHFNSPPTESINHSDNSKSTGEIHSAELSGRMGDCSISTGTETPTTTNSSSSSSSQSNTFVQNDETTFRTIMSADGDSDFRLVSEEDTTDESASVTAASKVSSEAQPAQLRAVDGASESAANTSSSSSSIILIFGGMDTEGEIFDDCLLFRI